ncbi:glycoside hydrolase family 15 protein [Pedobacter sp.]|nr:glycoside hydrolase family 15 protein [Candidatus Saccharibacteria bacterium]
MARPIVLSNGEMHVGLNTFGQVHDFYYPYVGGENHAAAHALQHRIGLWIDGGFTWIDDGSWEFQFSYLDSTLIGITRATNTTHGIMLEMTDAVDAEQAAFIRNIHIINLTDRKRDVRLFMHQVFVISNSYASDTAQYLPDSEAIVHYKGLRSFIVSGVGEDNQLFDQHAIGLNGIEGHDGVYRDAEDGELGGNTVEHGRVDSVLRFLVPLEAHDSKRVHYWIAAGKSQREALLIHKKIQAEGALHRLLITDHFWSDWSAPARLIADKLDPDYRESFLQSVLLMKSHIDKRGAVIASTDTTMLNYDRDTYVYCWPRDGAHVMWPLIRLGYRDEPLHFFMFCRRILNHQGYLMQKYQPDGALGSSWHSYVHGDIVAPPIQEDETAIVLFLFAQYYRLHKDDKLLREFYPTMVAPMANFLASYVRDDSLPKPSYDLWEETFITSTYTTGVIFGALNAAASLAEAVGEDEDALRWRNSAEDMQRAAQTELVADGVLVKGLRPNGEKDLTLDAASLYGAFMFGLFDETSDVLDLTCKAIETRLATGGGIARYENDGYNRRDSSSIGNPWFITTLWAAQYHLEHGEPDKALVALKWTKDHMFSTGVLAEQLHPADGSPLSVAPLTWSQAEYVSCLLDSIPPLQEGL